MALWLLAVIVLIAVGVMPSGAQAHGGHPHASAVAASPNVAIAPRSVTTSSRDRLVAAVAAPSLATGFVAALACEGACCNPGCRTHGSCCTGAGLAPEAQDGLTPRGANGPALARALPARTDVVPEALPEPPRFHA